MIFAQYYENIGLEQGRQMGLEKGESLGIEKGPKTVTWYKESPRIFT